MQKPISYLCLVILNSHTYYSFRYGTMSEKQLLETYENSGFNIACLTDINNTSACMSFVNIAKKRKIKPVIGIDFRNGVKQNFIGLAKNKEGFLELNKYLSDHLINKKDFPQRAPQFHNSIIIYPWGNNDSWELGLNEYIGITPDQLSRFRFSDLIKQQSNLVILITASFRNKKDYNTHRLLRAIDQNILLSKLSDTEQAPETNKFKSLNEITEIYKNYPGLIANTKRVLEQCNIDFEFGTKISRNKKVFTGSEEEDLELIKKLIEEGIEYRFGKTNETIDKRIKTELKIIRTKGFISYFLINWDILKYARSQGYYYVGRGSGANSLISYLLRITDVDPIELDLYFERFINLFRENPPDFDIDFSWKDREDITRYIFEKHGSENTALLATYTTFQVRAAIRELGKVFGLPKEEIDPLTKEFPRMHFGKVEGEKSRIPKVVGSTDHLIELVLKYAHYIEGFPNYLGIHAGGILISEESIYNYSALNLPPKGWNTVQFDMVVAEDIGLHKFDILSQRGLGHIKDAIEIIYENNPGIDEFDIHDIESLKNDPRIKQLLKTGRTLGCFYVESPAMRMLLTKLRADNYLGLVAASSIIRPGVAKSGMMREYILRHRNPDRRKEVNKVMQDIMPETYGIMVYQEDVIKVAHHFAGLTLAEADVLRRGMSGKYRSKEEFQKVRQQFFKNCKEKGEPTELAKEVWFQIESFAGYSFSKGHSASYAVESYQSLFLKAYYPREFMVAVINNFGGFYHSETYIHELKMTGADIIQPCVNNSAYFTIIRGKKVYIGFVHVKELGNNFVEDFLTEREKHGPYKSLQNFVTRNSALKEQVLKLIQIGAFAFTGKTKKELFWEIHLVLHESRSVKREHELFAEEEKEFKLPQLEYDKNEDAFDEMELLGFPLSNPFEILKDPMESNLKASDLYRHLNENIVIYGYLVHVKYAHAKGRNTMYFGTFLDLEGNFIDTVHFPNAVSKSKFVGKGVYIIYGKPVEEFDFISIEVSSMEKKPYMVDPKFQT